MNNLEILVLALILDAIIGDPPQLWQRFPHPVAMFGKIIARLERLLNRGVGRRLKGAIIMGLLMICAFLLGWLIEIVPDFGILEVLVLSVFLAHKSLMEHVGSVEGALGRSIDDGREAVARIVGRDPESLDESGITRAAIESGAENFSDGVVAPAFWFFLGGPAGLLVYKLVNTADSMIGHLTPRLAEFGWAAAKIDDAMNWIPARISGALIVIASLEKKAADVMVEDASLHKSPNAGWPEAAMAGALDVALAGPRQYEGEMTNDPFLNTGARRDLVRSDIGDSVRLLWRTWGLLLLVTLLMTLTFRLLW